MKKYLIKISLLVILLSSFCTIALASEDSNKEIYLTFDDGPGGKVTTQTLDILKSEDVKATFFLIGDQIKDQEELVKRIHEEGHSIGLHSMTHKKQNLYVHDEDFLKEMIECQNEINNVINDKVTILRFPFGVNNNTYHLKQSLVDLLHKNNLKIYDWNVDTTDGANPSCPSSLFIKKGTSDKDSITLLMHCGYINKNSPNALKELIKIYKSKGYTFKTITNDTPELYKIM